MLEGIFSAAAGMAAQQEQLDAVSNDLANESTAGYKAERVGFADLLYNQSPGRLSRVAGGGVAAGGGGPVAGGGGPVASGGGMVATGAGAAAAPIGRDQSEGALRETGNPLDLAIEGEGYFQIKRPDGRVALTRNGNFTVDGRGRIVDAQGDLLYPPITLPAGVRPHDVAVSTVGAISVGARRLGRIELVTVPSPDHLLAQGAGQFLPSSGSGNPTPVATPAIRQGALESSNVDMASEMVTLVTAQRSYQLASTAIQMESQMMSIASQLHA